jgi:hypothetical protein
VNNRKFRCLGTLITLILGLALPACALKNDSAPKDLPPLVNIPNNLNHLAQAAQGAGVVDCLGRLNQVSNFLIKDNPNNSAAFFMPRQDVNNRMLSTSFEIHLPQALTYTTAYFAPRGAAGCDGAYEAVAYWQNSCEVLAQKNYPQLKRIGMIHNSILALDGGAQLRVFLMPAGTGCVSIKKELIY